MVTKSGTNQFRGTAWRQVAQAAAWPHRISHRGAVSASHDHGGRLDARADRAGRLDRDASLGTARPTLG